MNEQAPETPETTATPAAEVKQMITALTKEQEAEFATFVDKYVSVGLKVGKIDKEKAKAFAKKAYAFLGRPEPVVVFTDGPTQAWLTTVWLNNLQADQAPVPADQLKIDLEAAKTMAAKIDFVWPYFDGQLMASWAAWVKYMQHIGVKLDVDISLIEDQLEFNAIYTLQNYCIFSERATVVHTKDKVLHCEGGPSIEFNDGTKCWSLNGIAVPQWLAETPWNQLDCSQFPTITNAEVRREFIRKIGVERLCQQFGSEVVDKQGDYELHLIDLKGTTGKWPYLKMLNPSIGCWHMECVGKECKTVADALKFRNQSDLAPSQLT